MITTQTIRITKSIPLPKMAYPRWANKEASVQISGDTLIIKLVESPGWNELLPKLRKVGKQVSRQSVKSAVAWTRKKS